MGRTLIVEPDPRGHRFEAVAHVFNVASRAGDVLLVTSSGAQETDTYREQLGTLAIGTEERFSSILPPTREIAEVVADVCGRVEVDTVVVMDADQSLKLWWWVAPRALRRLKKRPRIVFMLTRYPARLGLTDRVGWKLRITKATLAIVAMLTGSLHRVAGFAGREDTAPGWLVKRARDPAICTASAADRDSLRPRLGLAPDRKLVGIFGAIGERKNAAMTLEAILAADLDADLVLAGGFDDVVRAWCAALPPDQKARVFARDEFLSNAELDRFVASVDVIALIMTNNGPSGIMGKALAAGVPVVTAGSTVRARELAATNGGEAADFGVPSIGAAIGRVLRGESATPDDSAIPMATADQFVMTILGVDENGRTVGRR
ncbi:MAG: hypothetical protein NTV23_10665 [Propionibacteriales bacterium]|nr:hypothetical protein [Propionibacteriales bacterium]